MPGSIADESLTDYRRHLVSKFKLRGYSITEITEALAAFRYIDPETGEQEKLLNPQTGKPWCRATVGKDLIFLREQWKQDAARDTDEVYSEMLAQLDRVVRDAWDSGELALVLRSLKDKRDLIGIGKGVQPDEPTDDDRDLLLDMENMTNDQLTGFIRLAGFIASGGQPADPAFAGKPTGDIIEVSGGSAAEAR